MLYMAYWRDARGKYGPGFIRARTKDEALEFTRKKLQRGCSVTAIYKASPVMITPQSICLNFSNKTYYTLF